MRQKDGLWQSSDWDLEKKLVIDTFLLVYNVSLLFDEWINTEQDMRQSL